MEKSTHELPTALMELLEEEQIEVGRERCLLAGKVFTRKPVCQESLLKSLKVQWRDEELRVIGELSDDKLVFELSSEVIKSNVLKGRPWTFEKSLLVIADGNDCVAPESIPLDSELFWVQAHGMAAEDMTEEARKSVGNFVGSYVAEDEIEESGVCREYLRLRARINLSKPLRRSIRLNLSGKSGKYKLKYERLPCICSVCGILDHSESECKYTFTGIGPKPRPLFGLFLKGSKHEELVSSMNQVVSSLSFELSSECCIYRVSKRLWRATENAYTPQVVSIGPLHHGKEQLKRMEELKNRYLKVFLQRYNGQEVRDSLIYFIDQIKEKEVELRGCYAETIGFTSDEFVNIVLVDAAFIIEVLLRYRFSRYQEDNDRIFSKPHMLQDVWPDMRMLENQLPFFILQDLFDPLKTTLSEGESIIDLSHYFFKNLMNIHVAPETLATIKTSKVAHFVDFVRKLYPLPPWDSQNRAILETLATPSITELHLAGVKFVVGSETNMFEVLFKERDGTLVMPKLTISEETEVTITNLLAFEQSQCEDKEKYINDYFLFLNCLVKTPQDVALLVKSGILDNKLSSHKKGFTLIKNLVDGVVDSKDYFFFIYRCDDLNKYYNMTRHQWKEFLNKHFLYSPWATKEIIAAVIFLVLTLIQTVASFNFLWTDTKSTP